MKWLVHKSFIKSIFLLIWFFFIARTNFYIDIEKNIFQFNLKSWFNFTIDFLSICILIFLIIYLATSIIIKKKFPITLILILYPISGLVGYYNNSELHYYTADISHHFITLSSVILFLIIIDSSKLFNYRFYELLLKIIILLVVIFFLVKILPLIIYKLYNGINLRITYQDNILLANTLSATVIQNVNGQARILFILQLFFLILFKKFILKKNIISNIFFILSLIFLLIMFLMESRFIILASCISFCFIILSINNLKIKSFYIFFFIATVIVSSTLNKYQRFVNFNDETVLEAKIRDKANYENYINNNEVQHINFLYSVSKCSLFLNKIDGFLSGRLCGWEILIKNINKKDLFFGKGFFLDKQLLKPVQKTSSNSWINILYNTGIISLTIVLLFTILFLFKFFKFKNINNQNIYVSFSNYLLIFVLCRSLLEDTITFVNIDLVILIASLLITKSNSQKNIIIKKTSLK
jgi:hypothetical protein